MLIAVVEDPSWAVNLNGNLMEMFFEIFMEIFIEMFMEMFMGMFMDVDSSGWGAISGRKGRLFNGSLPPLLLSPFSFFCILSKNP